MRSPVSAVVAISVAVPLFLASAAAPAGAVAPAVLTVTSAEYPDDGNIHDAVGRPGTFTITAGAGGEIPARFGYYFTPAQGNTEPISLLTLGESPGCDATSCSFTKTPTTRGVWRLDVWGVDHAGRRSGSVTYRFRVRQIPDAKAYWRLEDAAGSETLRNEIDPQGANVLSLTGTDAALRVPARVGSDALRLNTDADPATHGLAETTSPVVDPAKSYTVSVWARATNTGRSATVAGQDGTRASAFRIEQTSSGNWAMSAVPYDRDDDNPVSQARSQEPVRAGQWTHLVGVHDASTKEITLYVDGVPQGTTAFDADGWAAAEPGPFALGRGLDAGAKGAYFSGEIDDVRVFDKAVPAARVAGWYRPTVQARWKLNAPVGSAVTVPDDTGAGHGLTLRGGAEIKDDGQTCANLSGECLELGGPGVGGVGGWAQPDGPVIRTDRSFTIAGWVEAPTRPAVPMTVFSAAGEQQSAITLRFHPRVGRNPNYDPELDDPSTEYIAGWQIEAADRDGAEPVRTTAAHWQSCNVCTGQGPDHLALVYDAPARKLTLYVNGSLQGTQGNTSVISDLTVFRASGALQIGRRLADGKTADGDESREYFSGLVDDVWVFNGALSEHELIGLGPHMEVDTFTGNPQLPDMYG